MTSQRCRFLCIALLLACVGCSSTGKPRAGDTYCSRCGVIPGQATTCPHSSSHNFASRNHPVYCSRCGAVPSNKPTLCPTSSSHNFVHN